MRATAIDIGLVMVRPHAPAGRIWHAYRRYFAVPGNTVGARKGAEVTVEGPVFLHDNDDVADLVDSREHVDRRGGTRRTARRTARRGATRRGPFVRAAGGLGRCARGERGDDERARGEAT